MDKYDKMSLTELLEFLGALEQYREAEYQALADKSVKGRKLPYANRFLPTSVPYLRVVK